MNISKLSAYKNSLLLFFFLFLAISFLSYFNILSNQLFYDDEELIYKNYYIQNLSNFPKYFSENMIAGAGKTSNMYRPLLLTSFAIDYSIWKNSPIGYHLTSILLHGINGFLIFILLQKLFGKKIISLLTGVFFIIHPVQTEAVAYASGRIDLLYTCFTLLALITFLRFLQSGKNKIIYYSLSLTLCILAVLSKETAIIFPLLLVLTIFIFTQEKDVLKNLIYTLPFFLIVGMYTLLRFTLLRFGNILNFYPVDNVYSQNILIRIYSFARALFDYLSVLIFPKDLIFARQIPTITSFLNIYVIGFILLFLIGFLLSWKFFPKQKLFLFAFLWFFITLVPLSGIIPINNIIAEHYLYLPSIGFFLIISFAFSYAFIKHKSVGFKLTASLILLLVMSLLLIRTLIRNADWKDPITFYTKSISQSPWHIPMRHNLAMAYSDIGRDDLAIEGYKNIIAISDTYPNPHHNLANIYQKQGKFDLAEIEYQYAIQIDPNFLFSYTGLLDLYKETKDDKKYQITLEKLQAIEQSK